MRAPTFAALLLLAFLLILAVLMIQAFVYTPPPLEALPPIDPLELVRMIAVARILLPRSKVRLSAGRTDLPREAQLVALGLPAQHRTEVLPVVELGQCGDVGPAAGEMAAFAVERHVARDLGQLPREEGRVTMLQQLRGQLAGAAL